MIKIKFQARKLQPLFQSAQHFYEKRDRIRVAQKHRIRNTAWNNGTNSCKINVNSLTTMAVAYIQYSSAYQKLTLNSWKT